MTYYHLVGADISFPGQVDELDIFDVEDRNNFSSLRLSYTPRMAQVFYYVKRKVMVG